MNKVVIITNPLCHQGKGWKRWLSIREDVRKRFAFGCKEIVLEKGVRLDEILPPLLQPSEKMLLVSAGGDGSVHYLVNYLMDERKNLLQQITLGAVGLGSSNDFLKPFGEKINGIPFRIDYTEGSFLHDVGLATYRNENGELRKYFIVNASLGVTAEANWNFNNPGCILRLLKKRFTAGAIGYAAVSTILGHRNTRCSLKFNGKELNTLLSNVNVLKVPYVSGSFFYNQSISRDDGRLALNVCKNMSRRELLKVLAKLQKGIFPTSKKTLTEFTNEVSFAADSLFVFECDGETEKTTALSLTVLPKALAVLKS